MLEAYFQAIDLIADIQDADGRHTQRGPAGR